MKLLVDMNLPPKFAVMLAENGIDAVHWYKIGAPDAKDFEILTYAISNEMIEGAILTIDAKKGRLRFLPL